MAFSKLLATLILLICSNAGYVVAFPSGAGACEEGIPSVFGPHLDPTKKIVRLSLEEARVRVKANGVRLLPGKNKLSVGESYEIKVYGRNDFRGVLIRVGAGDADFTVEPGENTQLARACEAPAQGVTHVNNTLKNLASGIVEFSEAAKGVKMDVNVVYINSDIRSRYAHGQFELVFA